MAQTKEKENTVPAARAKQNAAAAPAAAGEKRPRTTRRPYYNRRPRRPQQPKEAATPIHIYPLGGLGEVGKNMTVYECNGDMIIVDCGLVFPDSEMYGVDMVIPDFTFVVQNKDRIKGLLITHGHEDHIGGLDDVRAFNFVDYPPTVHKVHIWAAPRALECVRKDFDYAFAQDKYRGVPEIELHEIDTAKPFRVGDVEIVPVSGHHSERFEVTGFRIGPLAYLTDFKTIEDAEAEKLRGTEVLAVNALRFAPHPSHFNLAEALALIRRVGPREAYITHMSHEIGLHAETEATLPPGVHLAYDGLEVEI